MGTLLVAATVIMTMRVRVELLISRLYDAARTDRAHVAWQTGAAFASCSTSSSNERVAAKPR